MPEYASRYAHTARASPIARLPGRALRRKAMATPSTADARDKTAPPATEESSAGRMGPTPSPPSPPPSRRSASRKAACPTTARTARRIVRPRERSTASDALAMG
jgi:hypothetical protein